MNVTPQQSTLNSWGHVLISATSSPARPYLVCQMKIQSERKSIENKGNTQSSGEQRCLEETGNLCPVAVISLQALLHQICPELHISAFLCEMCQHHSPNALPFSDTLLPAGLGCCMPVILVCSDTKGWCRSTDKGDVSPL